MADISRKLVVVFVWLLIATIAFIFTAFYLPVLHSCNVSLLLRSKFTSTL